MKTISGFTFVYNALEGGYPIVEAIKTVQLYVDEIVVVDMQSTDGTREVLEKLVDCNQEPARSFVDHNGDDRIYSPIVILNGFWGNEAGETLRQAHSKYIECSGDVIIHFEADEVFDHKLIQRVVGQIRAGSSDIAVYRLQIEQNFQRCRWYPEPVHRVFSRLSNTRKEGHTTNRHDLAFVMEPKSGYLWNVTNCFRDNWFNRANKQAELRQSEPQYLMTGLHSLHKVELTKEEAKLKLGERHWTFTNTPFDIPAILRPLVGCVKYEPNC